MPLSLFLPLALAALIVEALIGYPAPLYRAIGHPVTWMGRWLAWLEAGLNRPEAGFLAGRGLGGGGGAGCAPFCFYPARVALAAGAAPRLCVSAGPLGFAALALLA